MHIFSWWFGSRTKQPFPLYHAIPKKENHPKFERPVNWNQVNGNSMVAKVWKWTNIGDLDSYQTRIIDVEVR